MILFPPSPTFEKLFKISKMEPLRQSFKMMILGRTRITEHRIGRKFFVTLEKQDLSENFVFQIVAKRFNYELFILSQNILK